MFDVINLSQLVVPPEFDLIICEDVGERPRLVIQLPIWSAVDGKGSLLVFLVASFRLRVVFKFEVAPCSHHGNAFLVQILFTVLALDCGFRPK